MTAFFQDLIDQETDWLPGCIADAIGTQVMTERNGGRPRKDGTPAQHRRPTMPPELIRQLRERRAANG